MKRRNIMDDLTNGRGADSKMPDTKEKDNTHRSCDKNDKYKPKKFKPIGIRWRIIAYLALFTSVILLLMWLCQSVFLSDIYKIIKTGEIKLASRAVKDSINSDDLEKEASHIAQRGELCLLVLTMIDENTAIELVSVETLKDCAIHNTDKNSKFTLYDLAKANGGELLQRFRFDPVSRSYYSVAEGESVNGDAESIIYTIITENKAGESILIMLNSVISPVSATVKTLNILLAVISGLMLLLSLGLAFFISRRISHPIIKINNCAKILAAGNYDVSFRLGGYREISELAETLNYAAKELSKVEALRRELIANISHDLRTPLTMIEGYSEVIRDLPGENTPENVQIIIDEARRLTSLVNDVLDISKFESGLQQFKREQVNLTRLIKQALIRYNKLTKQQGYTIEFIYDREITLPTDRDKIMQVIYNLVNNAVTYTGADKRVVVRQTEDDDFIRLSVTDSGEGIPPEKIELIWERYYKSDNPHKRASIGTGLGLSIVKSIMNLCGGRYGVESVPGLGSTFWIELRKDGNIE